MNNTNTLLISDIEVIAYNGSCRGTTEGFLLTVVPSTIAPMQTPAPVTVCGGAPVIVEFIGPQGAGFHWTNSNPAIGLPASGTGHLNFTSAPVLTQEVATITVVPAYGQCEGTPVSFTITVNPPTVMEDPPDVTVCGGEAIAVAFTGPNSPTFSWTNSNTAIGLAASGTGNLNFTTANPATPQTAQINVMPGGGVCPGEPESFSIEANPRPSVAPVADVSGCSGQPVAVNFVGSPGAAVLSWTNDNPNIGLDPSGVGNISFTPTVTAVETANLTVTPTLGPCTGTPRNFKIKVSPTPAMNPVGDVIACAGQPILVDFTSPVNVVFQWTNNNPAIGLPASGTGDIQFVAPNLPSAQIGTLTVKPVLVGNNCVGQDAVFNIDINQKPTVFAADLSIGCDTLPVFLSATTNVSPANYQWTGPNGFSSTQQSPIIDTTGVYIVEITNPADGCKARDTLVAGNCCETKAGLMDTTKTVLCAFKNYNVPHHGNQVLEGNDGFHYILFSNKNDWKNSLVQTSDTTVFGFIQNTMSLDSTYYVAAIAADTLIADTLDLIDPCLSISRLASVKWVARPTIERVPTVDAFCRDGCFDLTFGFTGAPPFHFSLKISQNGLFLFDKTLDSDDFLKTFTLCPADFLFPLVGGELGFLVGNLGDGNCECGD